MLLLLLMLPSRTAPHLLFTIFSLLIRIYVRLLCIMHCVMCVQLCTMNLVKYAFCICDLKLAFFWFGGRVVYAYHHFLPLLRSLFSHLCFHYERICAILLAYLPFQSNNDVFSSIPKVNVAFAKWYNTHRREDEKSGHFCLFHLMFGLSSQNNKTVKMQINRKSYTKHRTNVVH